METILGIVGLFVVVFIYGMVVHFAKASLAAAGRAISGKGTFKDNLNLSLGSAPFEARLNDLPLDEKPGAPLIKHVEVKGLFPITGSGEVRFVTSVLDITEKPSKAVISLLDSFQEPTSLAFQHVVEGGKIQENFGFSSWVRVGVVIPDILQPPVSGVRKMVVILRMVDIKNPPSIDCGFHEGDDPPGILWTHLLPFDYSFKDKGYLEAVQDREEAQALSIKIAVAVAMADGDLADAEGETVKRWISRAVSSVSESNQQRLKKVYNDALISAYQDAEAGKLDLCSLAAKLNEIGEKRVKYDAIDLCFDVMAADGVADAKEWSLISIISEGLHLDIDEIKRLRDHKLVNVDLRASNTTDIKDLLGIQPEWSQEQVRKHLRNEFQKWNNRINTLPEGRERENAQRVLDMIADARKKSA